MDINFRIDPQSIKQIEEDKKKFKEGVLEGVRRGMYFLQNKTQDRFGRPGNLRVRSGRLRSSIMTKIIESGNVVRGTLGTNVFYGKIHELGKYPFIRPTIDENIDRFREYVIQGMERKR